MNHRFTLLQGVGIILGSAAVVLLLLSCGGLDFVIQGVFYLVAGWAFFLDRVGPLVRPNPAEVAVFAAAFGVVTLGSHWFCRWLYAGWNRSGDAVPAVWPWRWTGRLVGVLVLLFVAGTAGVGVTHQTGWLITSPEPIVRLTGGVRVAAARTVSSNNLKQLSLAEYSFEVARHFLPAPTFTPDGRPLHSWHTALLPYIEQDTLAGTIDPALAWDHPDNRVAVGTDIEVFRSPYPMTDGDPPAVTHYAPDARLFDRPHRSWDFAKNGTSNTLLAAEAVSRPKPWADPGNWRDPRLGLNKHPDGFGGPWPSVTIAVFLDGHVQAVPHGGWDAVVRRVPLD